MLGNSTADREGWQAFDLRERVRRPVDNRLHRARSPLRSSLSQADKFELCRAAKRAWMKLPARSSITETFFAWQGESYIARSSLFAVHVYDARDRWIIAMYW
jgi:hypothetical protein